MTTDEFFASCFDAIEDHFYIGFSEAEGGKHYFILAREEEDEEDMVPIPNRKNIYAELDDRTWAEDVGIDWVTLSRNQLTVRFGSDTITLSEYSEVTITFSLEDSDFERLRNVLQKIMKGYEDRLNLVD
ncbi:MAG: hypothetical protein F6K32_11925 [Desertifilum sp. SIO1I2]|nr:hypothetical protein [Desertifilum sp. SIO1I2]